MLIILQQFPLLKERMPLIEDESDQDDIEMVSESRRDVKTSNGDSQENCDIQSSGSDDSIFDDEGLVHNSVSQIQTDIQDNMTEL